MLFLCFSTEANLRHVFKMSSFGTYTCFDSFFECHWSVDAVHQGAVNLAIARNSAVNICFCYVIIKNVTGTDK